MLPVEAEAVGITSARSLSALVQAPLSVGRWVAAWRRRRQELSISVQPGPALAGYASSNVWKRHRNALYAALAIFAFLYGFVFALFGPVLLLQLALPIVLLAALTIWLLPDSDRAPTRLMTRAYFCYFVAIQLWPYYLAFQIPGLPLIEPRRLFMIVSLLALLICYSTSAPFRDRFRAIFDASPVFFKLYGAFLAVQFLSLVASPDPGDALQKLIKNQFNWTATLLITCYVLSFGGAILKWATTLRVVATILSLIAFAEFRNQKILWADHIPSFLKVNDPAMVRLLSPVFREGDYRVTTTFSVSLAFAEFMSLCLPFFLHYIFEGSKTSLRIVCGVAHVMVVAAILLTQARIGAVGIVVAHSIYILPWAIRRQRAVRNSLIAPAIIVAYPLMLMALIAAVLSIGRLRAFVLGGGSTSASTAGRLEQAVASVPVLLRRPLFGYGPGQGGSALDYRNPAGELSIDSSILSVVLDYGVIGFVLYFGMLVFMLIKAAQLAVTPKDFEQSYVASAAVAMLVWLASRIALAQEDNSSTFYMILGLVAAVAYRARQTPVASSRG